MTHTKNVPTQQALEKYSAGTGGVSLGKGAWDCDRNCEIPPEKEVSQILIVGCFGRTGAMQLLAGRGL